MEIASLGRPPTGKSSKKKNKGSLQSSPSSTLSKNKLKKMVKHIRMLGKMIGTSLLPEEDKRHVKGPS